MIGKNASGFHGRIVLIGDSSVGKTSLLNMLVEKTFNPVEQSTVGANYQLFIDNESHVEMQVWDTAGQEKYRSLGPIYYRNAQGAIVVYDQTSKESFNNLDAWIDAFVAIAGTEAIIAIVANKCDLPACEVTEDEAKIWAEKNDYLFYKTSAKTGLGVNEMFTDLVKKIVERGGAQQSCISGSRNKKSGCC